MTGNEKTNRSDGFSAWLTPGRFAALLGVFLFAVLPDVLTGSKTLFHHDFTVFGYPLAYYHRESFWRGEMPFWNPLNNCGLPFLAQWNTLTLYPGSLIYLLLPLPWSLNFYSVAHLFFAGIGMYFLAWRWSGSRLGASVAGLAFAMNGLAQCCLIWPNNVAAFAWTPWVVWLGERAWMTGGRNLAMAALAGGMQMLTGAPELILFTWLILGMVTFREIVRCKKINGTPPSRGTIVMRFAVVATLVFGLAAAQMFPFLDLLKHSQRDQGYSDTVYSMPALGWFNFVVPLFDCFASRYGVYFQTGQNWTTSYYMGIGVLLLGVIGLLLSSDSRRWWLAAIGFFGALMALGDNSVFYPWVRKILPQLGFINFPIKFVALAVFSLPLLAAMGVRALEQGETGKRWRFVACVSAVLLAVAVAAVLLERFYPQPRVDWHMTLKSAATRMAFLPVALLLFFFGVRAKMEKTKMLLQLTFLLVTAADLWMYGPKQTPRIDPGILGANLKHDDLSPMPKPEESRVWIDRETHYRVGFSRISDPASHLIGLRLMLHLDCNLLDNIPKGNGFFSLYLRDMEAVKALVDNRPMTEVAGLMDFLSAAYIPNGSELGFRKRDGALPMITGGQKPIFGTQEDILRGIAAKDFDPRKIVFLPTESRAEIRAINVASVHIGSVLFAAQKIEAEIEASDPALMVVSQAYYHRWKALIDGKLTPIWKANGAFQAIEVPKGRHRVKFVYEDKLFFVGTIISLMTLVGCLTLWWRNRGGIDPICPSVP